MLLVIDIGNTNISLGIYNNGIKQSRVDFPALKGKKQQFYNEKFKTILYKQNITECIISSVADELTKIVSETVFVVCNIKPLVVTSNLEFGITIPTEYSKRIGADRLVNASAAAYFYSAPAIVVDFGTATTFDIINENKEFIGGIIMPGIGTQLKSLNTNTSKLPKIEVSDIDKVKNTININTKNAMLTGVIQGHAYAVEGLISNCIQELKKQPVIIGTGGFSNIVSKYTKTNVFNNIVPDLTLDGLSRIYVLNNKT